MKERNNLISKLVYRLVKRRIAGYTIASILNAVKAINDKGMHATVTLLNDHVDDATKAKYNANSYVQLMKQLSRLHLNADISVRPSQLGYGVDGEIFSRNLSTVISAANSYGMRVWAEAEPSYGNMELSRIYKRFRGRCRMLGAEMIADGEAGSALRDIKPTSKDAIKIRYHENGMKLKRKDKLQLYRDCIAAASGHGASITLLDDDIRAVSPLANGRERRRDLIFEMPLGYSSKSVSQLQRSKASLSVYVPYGKDWIPYFINRLAEGRVRRIAAALLSGNENGKADVDIDAENEAR